jgi:hypothetical protein
MRVWIFEFVGYKNCLYCVALENSHPISPIERLFSVELYIHFLVHTSIF